MSSASRSACAMLIATLATACSVGRSEPPAPARVLRVCADPNNLPFSNQAREGFENKIADLVAARLGAHVEYVWWAQRRGFIRNTLRTGSCEVVMGLPSGLEMAATTRPYYRSSYVFVTRRGAPAPASFDDPYLRTATVGVHLIGDDGSNSPPAHALSNRGLINNVRGYSIYGDYRTPNPPADLIKAVARGDIDVAVAWGPLAGYFASQSSVPLQVTRVHPDAEPPLDYVFDMSMGVARSNKSLLEELNGVISANGPAIHRILRDFSVPTVNGDTVAAR